MSAVLLTLVLSLSISAETMVWANYSSSNWDLYLQKNGGEIKRLTKTNTNEYYPRFSHDGRWIYFVREVSGKKAIRRMTLTGREDTFKVSVSEYFFSLVGKNRIIFERRMGNKTAIWWKDLESGREWPAKVSANRKINVKFASQPDATYDGKTIFFLTKRWVGWSVARYPGINKNVSLVGKGCAPVVSPDGKMAVYAADRGHGGNAIRAQEIASGKEYLLIDLPGDVSLEYDPKFSNDGKWLLFCATKNGQRYVEKGADYKLFKYRMGSSLPPVEVLDLPGADRYPDLYIGD